MDELYRLLEKIKPDTDFKASKNYVEDGLLDSLEIVQIIEAISEVYGIELDGLDIDPDNFITAEKIWKMIMRYKK